MFVKGKSGNPAGRRPGSRNKRTLLTEQLEQAGAAVQAVVIKKALEEEDMQAASLVMSRIHPPLRPRAERVQFKLDPDASFAEQSKQILTAVSRGELDLDQAKALYDVLAAHAGMQDMQTYLSELHRLKESKTPIPGGVITT